MAESFLQKNKAISGTFGGMGTEIKIFVQKWKTRGCSKWRHFLKIFFNFRGIFQGFSSKIPKCEELRARPNAIELKKLNLRNVIL